LRDTPIRVSAINPGFVATDINDNTGVLTPEQGVRRAIELATMADPAPTGGFFNDTGIEPW
ncbi:MAG TPA: short-chain dehydrogenase, partial [Sphingobium sp.]|nr:short-chain dehydrogenase [Sphingobium sp.]